MYNYVRAKISIDGGKTVIAWFSKIERAGLLWFTKLDKYGEMHIRNKIYVYILTAEDVIWEKKAIMSKKYAELEIEENE